MSKTESPGELGTVGEVVHLGSAHQPVSSGLKTTGRWENPQLLLETKMLTKTV